MKGQRAACYIRVSDKDLELQNQVRDLQEWATRQGYRIVHTYSDTITGSRADRAGLKAALAGAHRREFDVLLISALDRLSREGIGPMLGHLQKFHLCGVRVQSLREAWLDSDNPAWELMVAIFAWVARQERERCRERIMAGLRLARERGKRLGRPPKHRVDAAKARELLAQGMSLRAAARSLTVPHTSLRRALATGWIARLDPVPADAAAICSVAPAEDRREE